ncbi:MAG: tetratricopeptide repeat protein, partial [Rhodothermales bacterium]
QKFIRRNQTVVVAGLLVFFALIGGIAAATVGLVRAQKAEQVAQQEALTSQSVSDFLVQLFEVSDPGVARGNSITAREILDQGAERIEVELKDQPNVRAKLLHTMGKVYWELGLEDESMDLLREAIDLRKATLGDDHADVAESMRALATTLSGHFGAIMPDQREEILSLLHEARAIHEEQLGPAHPEVAEDWASIAVFTMDRLMQEDPAEYEQAIDAGKKALDIWTEAYGVDDPRLHKMLYKLGGWYRDWNKDYETAAGYYARSAAIIESNYGPESGLMMEPLYGLYRMEYQKDFRSAETINAFNRMWGVSDEEIINSDANPSLFITTASFLQSTGHLKEAEDALERAARLLEKKYGADVEDMVFAHARLIQLYIPQERWTEIEEKAKWTRPIWEQNGSRTNVANTFYYAGLAQVALGRLDEAEHSFLEALSVYEEISTRFDLPTVLWELGRVYRLQGKTQQADAVEKRMRTAAFASTQGERTRAANDRFYAMALLNCREQWKIRTVMYDCYSAPFDKVAGLTHAQKAYDDSPDSMHNLVVLALAHHFSGNNEDAIRFINEAITKVHEASPTMNNLQYWLRKINSTPDSH